MEISRFIISQELNNSTGMVLAYSTLTTKFVLLDRDTYHKIFELADFSDEVFVNALLDAGVLTNSYESQIEQLEIQRTQHMESSRQHLTIFPTTDCNARCFYCFENGIKHIDMSKEVADATIQFVLNNFPSKELSIGWIGGEPLLRFDIIEYITKRLVDSGYILCSGVSTNGILLTEDMIKFLKQYNKQVAIQFSLDAAVGKEYYKIKRYVDYHEEDAFRHVVDNIAMSLDYGLTTDIRINFAASNIEKAKNAFRTIKNMVSGHDLSNAFIFLVPLDIPGSKEVISDFHGNMEHPCLQAIKFQKEMGFGVPRSQRVTPIRATLNKVHGDIIASNALMPTCYVCGMTTKYKFVVDSDGTLYKCHRLAGHMEYNCGNVMNGVNKETELYKSFRETKIRDAECLECPILPICQGGCFGRRLLCGDSQKCHKIKQIQKDLVRIAYDELIESGEGDIIKLSE